MVFLPNSQSIMWVFGEVVQYDDHRPKKRAAFGQGG